jgi:membrane protein DedA with SNARE-associated domain
MEQTQAFLMQWNGVSRYCLFFFVTAGCGIGLPMNSDLLLITASYLAVIGYFQFWILLPLAFFALLLGDSINFFVARRYGKQLLRVRPFRWILKEQKVNEAEQYLNTHGTKFLFFVRFLPLIRTVLFFSAGCLQVKPRVFYTLDGLSTLLYLPLLMGSAYYASNHLDALLATLKKFQFGLLGILILVGLFFWVKKKARKPIHS